MPKEKNFKNEIPALYKKNAEDLLMYGWVTAQKAIVPSLSVSKSIKLFMDHFNISEDDMSLETAQMVYNRLNETFLKQK